MHTRRAYAEHLPSDIPYVIEFFSTWHGEPGGFEDKIIQAARISRYILFGNNAHPDPAMIWNHALIEEDAEWLQAENAAGRLSLPFGSLSKPSLS